MFYHRVIPLKCALILCLIILFSNNDSLFVNGRRNGAPIESCITLKPRHGNNIQSQPKSTNPFLFNVTLYPYMNEEEFIHVEIHSHNDHQVFRGFIVQARMANNPEMIADGTFVPIDSNQTRSFTCNENNMEGNVSTESFYHQRINHSYFFFLSHFDLWIIIQEYMDTFE